MCLAENFLKEKEKSKLISEKSCVVKCFLLPSRIYLQPLICFLKVKNDFL